MATVKLDLVKDVWQEIGAISFVFSKGTQVQLEIVSAASLPVGDVPEAMKLNRADLQIMPAATDPWFIRTTGETAVFKYTEV